jgi:hypothetical protein
MPVEDEDRYRTAAVSLDGGIIGLPGLKAGLNLFTGDPGPEKEHKKLDKDGFEYYAKSGSYDPDQYRAGALWISAGPIRLGRNSEGIRHTFQNRLIHDPGDIPRFSVLGRQPEMYFYFGSGSGTTLW